MIIEGFTAQGKIGKAKTKAKAHVASGSMGLRQSDNPLERFSLEVGAEFLARRNGEPLPVPPEPMASVTLDNGDYRVTLTYAEIKQAYEFATRKGEHEKRLAFNLSLDKASAGA